MRARFKGDPERNNEGPEAIQAFGLSFQKGAWVGVDSLDPVSMRKLLGNSHFETDGGKVAAPSAPTAPVADQIPANWQESHHSTRLKWARGLGATPANVQEADAFLAAYMAPKADPTPAAEPVAAPKPSIVDPPTKDDDWGDLEPE